MGNKLNFDGIFGKSFLKTPINRVELLLKQIKELKKQLKILAKIQAEEISKADPRTSEGIKKSTQAEKEAIATKKAFNTLVKQEFALRTKLRQAQNGELKTTISLRQEINKLNKETKQEINLNKQKVSSLKRTEVELIKNRQAYASLTKAERENTRAGQNLLKTIQRQDKEVKKLRATMGQHQREVGNYGARFRSLATSMASAIGLTAGITGIIRLFRSGINIVAEFGRVNSKLSAILQINKKDMIELTAQQKVLGANSAFSAVRIGELQVQLAKLGFSMREIEAATPAMVAFSEATGENLADAGSVAASTLRAFGLAANEAGDVASTMALSFVKSGLDLEKFRESMKLIAPIARAANIDLETTTALLGILADNGLSGSLAGTGLKNVISKLSNENSKLSKELGFTVKNSDDLIKAFQLLKDSNIDLTEATELTDERSKAAFITMIDGIDSVEELREAIKGNEQAMLDMAEVAKDNLGGDLDKLKSAWEGLLLRMEDGESVFRKVVQSIIWLINNIGTITKTLAPAIVAFTTYKLVLKGAVIATNLAAKANTLYRISQIAMSQGLTKTIKKMKLLNKATKANTFAAIAALILALVAAFKLWNGQLTIAEKVQKTLNKVQEKATENTAAQKAELDSLVKIAENKNLADEDRIKAIEKLNELSPELLGNLTLENIATEEGARLIDEYVASLDRKAIAQAIQEEKTRLFTELIKAENSSSREQATLMDELWRRTIRGNVELLVQNDLEQDGIENKANTIKGIEAEIDALDNLLKAKIESGELGVEEAIGEGLGADEAESAGLIAQKRKQIAEQRKATDNASTISAIRNSQSRTKQLQKELDVLIGAKDDAKALNGLQLLQEDLKELNELRIKELFLKGESVKFDILTAQARQKQKEIKEIKEKLRLNVTSVKSKAEEVQILFVQIQAQKQLIDVKLKGRDFDEVSIDAAKIKRREAISIARVKLKFLKEEIEKTIKLVKIGDIKSENALKLNKLLLTQAQLEQKILDVKFSEAAEARRKNQLDLEIAFNEDLLLQKETLEIKRQLAEDGDKQALADLHAQQKKIEIATIKHKLALLRIEEEAIRNERSTKKTAEDSEEFKQQELRKTEIDLERQALNDQLEAAEEGEDKKVKLSTEAKKAILANIIEVTKKIGEELIERSKDREEILDLEIQDSKDTQSQILSNIQAAGVTTTESLKSEKEKQDALVTEKKSEQREQQRIRAILAVLDLISALAQSGNTNAGSSATQQVADAVTGIADAVPGFYDGTTHLERNGAAKGKDTIHIKAHEGERIVPEYNNKLIPRDFPNHLLPDAVKAYQNFDNMNFVPVKSYAQAENSLAAENLHAIKDLGGKMEKVEKAIKKIPKDVTDWDGILNGLSQSRWKGRNKKTVVSPMDNRLFPPYD